MFIGYSCIRNWIVPKCIVQNLIEAMSFVVFDQAVNILFFKSLFLFWLDFLYSKLDCSKMHFPKLDWSYELKFFWSNSEHFIFFVICSSFFQYWICSKWNFSKWDFSKLWFSNLFSNFCICSKLNIRMFKMAYICINFEFLFF